MDVFLQTLYKVLCNMTLYVSLIAWFSFGVMCYESAGVVFTLYHLEQLVLCIIWGNLACDTDHLEKLVLCIIWGKTHYGSFGVVSTMYHLG